MLGLASRADNEDGWMVLDHDRLVTLAQNTQRIEHATAYFDGSYPVPDFEGEYALLVLSTAEQGRMPRIPIILAGVYDVVLR